MPAKNLMMAPQFVDGDLDWCQETCELNPLCAALLFSNRTSRPICAHYADVDAVVQATESLSKGQCFTKELEIGGWMLYSQRWMRQLGQLLLLTFFLFMSSTALNSFDDVRHNWRFVNAAVLPFSCFGGFCWFFSPDSDLVVLLLLWPCKAFADPRLDFAAIKRGLLSPEVKGWQVILNTFYALLHHAGLCMLVLWTREVSHRWSELGGIESHPWPLLIVAIVEMVIWLVGAKILVRQAHDSFNYVLPGGLFIQVVCIVCMRVMSNDSSRDVILGTLVTGNMLGVIVGMLKIPVTSFDTDRDNDTDDTEARMSRLAAQRAGDSYARRRWNQYLHGTTARTVAPPVAPPVALQVQTEPAAALLSAETAVQGETEAGLNHIST
jgi:hypothetical protein